MANHMAEVAKLLGVELMETFKIADDIFGEHPKYYRFAENVCLEASNDGAKWDTADAGVLEDILMGDVRVVKLPWKPTKGEKYYVSHILDRDLWDCYLWNDEEDDEELYKRGVVFKTKEEAIEAAKKMLAAINEQ